MSGIIFWLVLAVIFVLLWWAGYYATKDMRVRKNVMREEQAKENLTRFAQQQAEEASRQDDASPIPNKATDRVDTVDTKKADTKAPQ